MLDKRSARLVSRPHVVFAMWWWWPRAAATGKISRLVYLAACFCVAARSPAQSASRPFFRSPASLSVCFHRGPLLSGLACCVQSQHRCLSLPHPLTPDDERNQPTVRFSSPRLARLANSTPSRGQASQRALALAVRMQTNDGHIREQAYAVSPVRSSAQI